MHDDRMRVRQKREEDIERYVNRAVEILVLDATAYGSRSQLVLKQGIMNPSIALMRIFLHIFSSLKAHLSSKIPFLG
ncbi:hypothetical protein Trydic_g13958 [Trypoxylus dichotomus]